MNFKTHINNLMNGQRLSESEACELMLGIGSGDYNDAQSAALIVALSRYDITLEEICGFRQALLELSIATPLHNYDTIDLCGTGGDGKNTFNISTLASFVVAGAGYQVAKHGNYGVSSVSGSSNVLELLGYRFSASTGKLERELDAANICFLHAPLFHPALRHVAGIRQQLGIKTIFNTLGPLVNPAKTQKQCVGVFNLRLARLYHYLLQQENKSYTVLHATDGYDEISLTGPFQYFSTAGEGLLDASDLGLDIAAPEALFGGESLEEAARLFLGILEGKGSKAQQQVVAANAGMAICCFEPGLSLKEGVAKAMESLESGKANQQFNTLLQLQ